jgi:hypothetical protein
MALPKIGWRNILRNAGATVTATSTASGFDVADVYNLRPWTIWKSAVLTSPIRIDIDLGASGSADADYLALVNTNIKALGGTVKVYADAVTIGTTQVQAAYTPGYDDVEYKEFTAPGVKRYWRVEIAHAAPPFSAAPFIGELFLGLKMTLTEYPSPDIDPFLKQVAAAGQQAEGGAYLGAILRGQTHRFTLATGSPGMARAFYTSDFNSFLDTHAYLMRPFVFVLDSADADFLKPVYVRKASDSDITRQAVGGVWNRLVPGIPLVEAWSETP